MAMRMLCDYVYAMRARSQAQGLKPLFATSKMLSTCASCTVFRLAPTVKELGEVLSAGHWWGEDVGEAEIYPNSDY